MASIGQPREPENGKLMMSPGGSPSRASTGDDGSSAAAPVTATTAFNVLNTGVENVQSSDTAVAGAAVLSADSHSKVLHAISSHLIDGKTSRAITLLQDEKCQYWSESPKCCKYHKISNSLVIDHTNIF